MSVEVNDPEKSKRPGACGGWWLKCRMKWRKWMMVPFCKFPDIPRPTTQKSLFDRQTWKGYICGVVISASHWCRSGRVDPVYKLNIRNLCVLREGLIAMEEYAIRDNKICEVWCLLQMLFCDTDWYHLLQNRINSSKKETYAFWLDLNNNWLVWRKHIWQVCWVFLRASSRKLPRKTTGTWILHLSWQNCVTSMNIHGYHIILSCFVSHTWQQLVIPRHYECASKCRSNISTSGPKRNTSHRMTVAVSVSFHWPPFLLTRKNKVQK